MVRLEVAALALAAIARGAPVPEAASSTLAERQFTIGNPWTGVWPPGAPDTPIIVFPGDAAPSTAVGRGDTGRGGSGSGKLKAVITPGKARRDLAIGGASNPGPALDLAGLEITLEQLMQQYGPSPPHDIYLLEEKIKSILIAYGITIVHSPDGTTTTITPSTKRAAAGYDLAALQAIFAEAVERYNGASPPLGDWLVLRDMAAVLQSYGTELAAAVPDPRAHDGVVDADAAFLQALLARLQASYGTAQAPSDIFLLEQTLATLLRAQGVAVLGWSVSVPGGPMVPGQTIPGGPMVPGPTIPGGPIVPSTKTRKRREATTAMTATTTSAAGLQAALVRLGEPYGSPGTDAVPLPIFLVMRTTATMLQGRGLTVPGWPPVLGDGSTVIGPSD